MLVESKIGHMPVVMFTLTMNEKEINIIERALACLPFVSMEALGVHESTVESMRLAICQEFNRLPPP